MVLVKRDRINYNLVVYKNLIFVEVTEDVYNEKLSTVIKFDMAPTIFLLTKGKLLYTIKGFNEFENIIKNEMLK